MKRGPAPSWFPLRRQILDSSVWEESAVVCKLWVTLLLIGSEPGRRGTADMTPRALAARACMTLEETTAALDVLMAPDPRSRSRNADGRRLELLDPARSWGWRLVNWEKYEKAQAAAGSTVRSREHRSGIGTERNEMQRNATEPTKEKDKEREKDKENEKEERRSVSASAEVTLPTGAPTKGSTRGPSDRTKRPEPPTEEEWSAYCRNTWPDWAENDARSAWSHYKARGWKGITDWRACAKTCYHRKAGDAARGAGTGRPSLFVQPSFTHDDGQSFADIVPEVIA